MIGSLRKSRFFDLFKRRSKRDTKQSKTPSDEFHSLPDTPTDAVFEDQRDGFYKYGESCVEDSLLSTTPLPPYEVSKDETSPTDQPDYFTVSPVYFPSQLKNLTNHQIRVQQMAPRRRHSRPYTVSSDEWVSSSSSSSSAPSQVLSLQDLTQVQLASHFGSVLKIFNKIYAIAKILHVVFLGYGLEVF